MRTVIQRVKKASVTISGKLKGKINSGLLILVAIESLDNEADILYLCTKICHLRIFADNFGVMNKSVLDIDGELLVISQFTLHASTKKGNRPSYLKAARPEIAIPLYELFCCTLQQIINKPIATGEFGADMQLELLNDGPVTIIIDSKNKEL